MDNARALTIAGILLACAALLGLFLVLTGGGEEPVALPEERVAAPTAPSQSPVEEPQPEPRSEGAVLPVPPTESDAPEDEVAAKAEPLPSDPPDETETLLADIAGAVDADEEETLTEETASPPAPGPVQLQPGETITFCFPGVIPVPGDCADRETVLALATETIGVRGEDGRTEALSVELADPAGLAESRTATTCEQYASLKANDWGPLTTVAMRRDREMNRFCGLIAMARRAAPGRGGLEALSEDLLEAMPDDEWPSMGEADVTNPIVLDTPGDPRVWFVQADRVEFTVRDVASADFDGDGANEVLVFTALQAADGTAVGGGYALAERAGGRLRLVATDPY